MCSLKFLKPPGGSVGFYFQVYCFYHLFLYLPVPGGDGVSFYLVRLPGNRLAYDIFKESALGFCCMKLITVHNPLQLLKELESEIIEYLDRNT